MDIIGSTNITSIDYDNERLIVGFRSGAVYEYYGVPEKVYENFIAATSKGQYHAAFIRDVYQYKRIG